MSVSSKESIDKMAACIGGIDEWMSSNHLKLNSDKTQFMCFTHSSSVLTYLANTFLITIILDEVLAIF